MESEVQKQPFTNDIFISYSRKDIKFARRLEKALEAYKPPKDLKETPYRNLVVFRDEEDITGVEYHQSIEKHLKNSKKLIIICSPNSRKSDFVNGEIQAFAKMYDANNIIPILLSGMPNNEATKPEQEDGKAFPEALCEIMQMPLATSYLGFDARKDKINKGAFSGSWYTLLANIYDASRSEIEQREKKKEARRRNIFVSAAIISVIILSGLSVWALFSRKEAVKQKNIAEDRLAKNYWSNAVGAGKDGQWLQATHYLSRYGNIEKGVP